MLKKRSSQSNKKKESASDPNFAIEAGVLTDAFHQSWMNALQAELITSSNVAYAPRQLMRAVLMAAETLDGELTSERLGEVAFSAWRKAFDEMADFRQLVPPTNSLN
jgi:hypothetical protein